MTASRLVTIFCDHPGCGQWEDAGIGDTATAARAGLKGRWRTGVSGTDGITRDYCPEHRKATP
ncbi:hypothetical protein QDA01_gp18 [Microbacterium phage Cinna]|jgi:hypothetical protein|uniref:Uncharacterized protein n=1 Tax=Microbacterium phage Cinna TaxID=2591215 RepID=A0A514DDG9_9CAUD|nr:hypothetical protein QDA01_gp18 [Microbacterium phage Cinna]QDH91671.1 hypothetical protein PBI_CINNA_87 [Microbacterium phage Cinna]